MGMRFRKSIKVAPGVKVNLNKNSVSVTAGVKGAHHTISSNGNRTSSVGIPGTGISYTKTTRKKTERSYADDFGAEPIIPPAQEPQGDKSPQPPKKKWYQTNFFVIFMLIFFFPVGLYLMWRYTNWKKPIKFLVTAFFVYAIIQSMVSPEQPNQTVEEPPVIIATPTPEITATPIPSPTPEPTATPEPTPTPEPIQAPEEDTSSTQAAPVTPQEEMVWIPSSGSKYHSNSGCSNMENPTQVAISEAEAMGYGPCKRCH